MSMREHIIAPPEVHRRVSEREITVEAARHPGSALEPHLIAARAAPHGARYAVGWVVLAWGRDVQIGGIGRSVPPSVRCRRL